MHGARFAAFLLIPSLLLGAELAPRGNMEGAFRDGLPAGWWNNCWGKNEAVFSRGAPRSGEAALKIECRSFETGAVQFLYPLEVQRGKHYTISLWMKADGAVGTVGVGLRHRPSPYTMHLSSQFEVGRDWERFAFEGTSTSGDDEAGLFIWFKPHGPGTLWVDDVSVIETEATPLNLPLPDGNVVPNASFELPIERQWRSRHVAPTCDTTEPYHGTRSLRWELAEQADQLAARCLEFGGKGKPFTLALAARSSVQASIVAELWPAVRPTASKPFLRLACRPRESWTVFRTTAALPSSSNGAYYLVIDIRPQGKATVWLDAVRLEPGDGRTPFRCRRPVEMALASPALAHIHDRGSPVRLDLHAFNDTGETRRQTVNCTVTDFWRKAVHEQSVEMELKPHAAGELPLVLPGKRTGVFLAEVRGGEEVLTALSYSVLPPPRDIPAERSAAGGHFRLDPFHLAVARRMGVKWTRIHDCESITHWRTVEPEQGRFVWHDAKVRLAREHGVRILGEFLRVPQWASSAGPGVTGHDVHQCPPRDMDEFAAYVRATVSHYKDDIRHWEVWNEPYHRGFWCGTAEEFATLAKVAARETHRMDPRATVVGPCAAPSTYKWVEQAMAAGALAGTDVFSYHGYGTFQIRGYELVRQWASAGTGQPLPIWNTETGVTSRSFYRHLPDKLVNRYTNWLRPVPYDVAAEHAVKLFVLALAGGAECYFHYWCVYEESLLPRLSAMSIFEYDGSLRPMGAAYALAVHLLDGTRGEGWIEMPGPALASLLRDERRAIAVLWRRGGRRPRTLRLPAPPEDLTARDLMGNNLPLQKGEEECLIQVSGEPLFLIAPANQTKILKDSLRRATRSP
jgi:hypothetical protein